MLAYSQKSTELACNASVAVLALANPECTDVVLLPLKPCPMSLSERAQLAACWSGRNLRSIGVFGLIGVTPSVALKEPLEPEQISALSNAFLAYLHALYSDRIAAHLEKNGDGEAWLEKLYSLEDSRPEA